MGLARNMSLARQVVPRQVSPQSQAELAPIRAAWLKDRSWTGMIRANSQRETRGVVTWAELLAGLMLLDRTLQDVDLFQALLVGLSAGSACLQAGLRINLLSRRLESLLHRGR
jgi:hypothetical protein